MKECNDYCICSTDRFSFGNETKGIVVIANPQDSGINMQIIQINHANLSSFPLVIDSYNCSKVTGDLTFSELPTIENKHCSACNNMKAKIAYGSGSILNSDRHLLVHTILPYHTYFEPLPCILTLPPGTNRVYQFEPIGPKSIATLCSGFIWTEEPINGLLHLENN